MEKAIIKELLRQARILSDEDFARRLKRLSRVQAVKVGEYFADVLAHQAFFPAEEYNAVKRNADATIHDFLVRVVTMRDPDARNDFDLLAQILRLGRDGNGLDDLRSMYEVAAVPPQDPQQESSAVFFHLLNTNDTVVTSIAVDGNLRKMVELDNPFTIEGRNFIVQRIAFDHRRIDVFLRPIVLH